MVQGLGIRLRHSTSRPATVALLLAALALLLSPAIVLAGAGADPAHHTLRLEAGQYRFTPGVVRVRHGDLVTIELVATDVVHGLFLDGYELELAAEPGKTARITFVADRAGTFRFRCSIPCGALHPFMIGKLQVGQNRLFLGALGLALAAAGAGLAFGRKAA